MVTEDNLHNLIQSMGPLSLLSKSTIQQIMFNLLKSLSVFSSHGIIHRNIKPSNIIVEDDLKIKIINFSLATNNSALVTTAKICGTPGYIAPEVFKWGKAGAIYNEKCDVFAAGCVFFEMLFGYPLFEELFSGSLSFDKVTLEEIKQCVFNAISKTKNNSYSESLNLLFKLLEDNPKNRISAEEALKHPYFDTLYQQKDNEETVIDNSPLDISPVMPFVHGGFTDAVKMHFSQESQDFCDEETMDVSDEEPEILLKSATLNNEKFKKCPSMKFRETVDISDEELEIFSKYSMLNSEKFRKIPSMKHKESF